MINPALLPHSCNRSSLETMTGLSLSPTDFWGPSKLATLESILSRGEVGSQWGLNFMAALLVRETYKLTKRNPWIRTPLVSCRKSFPVKMLRPLSQVSPSACPLVSVFRLLKQSQRSMSRRPIANAWNITVLTFSFDCCNTALFFSVYGCFTLLLISYPRTVVLL